LSASGAFESPQRLGREHLVAAKNMIRHQFRGLNVEAKGGKGDLKVLRRLLCRKWFLLQMAEHLFVAKVVVTKSVASEQ
jgi:hypothetical protein